MSDNKKNKLENKLKCMFNYDFIDNDICLQYSGKCPYIIKINWQESEVFICSKYKTIEDDYSKKKNKL